MPTRRSPRRVRPLLTRRGASTARAAAPGLLAVLAAAALAGCSLVENEAERRADQAVDEATANAGEQIQGEVQEQADAVLDDSLDAVDTPCSSYLTTSESERSQAAGGVLRAIWLTELVTEEPPQDVVDAYAAAVTAGCEAAPESQVTDVARSVYDGGGFAPPQG